MANPPYIPQLGPYVQLGPSAMPGGYGQIQFENFQVVIPRTVQVRLQQQGHLL